MKKEQAEKQPQISASLQQQIEMSLQMLRRHAGLYYVRAQTCRPFDHHEKPYLPTEEHFFVGPNRLTIDLEELNTLAIQLIPGIQPTSRFPANWQQDDLFTGMSYSSEEVGHTRVLVSETVELYDHEAIPPAITERTTPIIRKTGIRVFPHRSFAHAAEQYIRLRERNVIDRNPTMELLTQGHISRGMIAELQKHLLLYSAT